jgi:hypothetical protein
MAEEKCDRQQNEDQKKKTSPNRASQLLVDRFNNSTVLYGLGDVEYSKRHGARDENGCISQMLA